MHNTVKILLSLALLMLGNTALAQVTLDSCSQAHCTACTGVTVTAPTGIDDGDVLYFHLAVSDDDLTAVDIEQSSVSISPTQLYYESNGTSYTQWGGYVVASSESGDYDFTTDISVADQLSARICVLADVDTVSGPLDVTYASGSHHSVYNNDRTPDPPSITTNTNNAMVMHFGHCIDCTTITDYAASSGYTIPTNGEQFAGGRSTFTQYKTVTSAGLENPGDITPTGDAATDDYAITVLAWLPETSGIVPIIDTLNRRRNQ